MNLRRRIAIVFALAVALAARDAAGQQLAVSPQQLQFGDQAVNTTSAAQTITVTNAGPPVTLGAVLLSGIDATSFSAANGCFNQALATGESCEVSISLAPMHSGAIQARLLVEGHPADYPVPRDGGNPPSIVFLSGNGTGVTPTYIPPRFEVRIVEDELPFNVATDPVGLYVTGFNNRDEFTGFTVYGVDDFCYDSWEHSFATPFVFSGSEYRELRNTPNSPFGSLDPFGCPHWSISAGIDDAGNLFGVAVGDPPLDGGYSYRYSAGVVTPIREDRNWVNAVTSNGIALFNDDAYWLNGQLTSAPRDVGARCPSFDASTQTWIALGQFCIGGFTRIVNLGGFAAGTTTTGSGLYTGTVYRNGVLTDNGLLDPSSPTWFNSVNSAGQAIGGGNGRMYYWDRRAGLHRLDDLLPGGWTTTDRITSAWGVPNRPIPAINDAGHILTDVINPSGAQRLVILSPVLTMPQGDNVAVQSGGTTLTFANVTTSGTTTVNPINAATASTVPGGFAISDTMAYEIRTTATFSGPVTLEFVVPGTWSAAEFNNLRVLHNENGSLVDITSGYDYSRLTIFATTTSFSPFYIARRGMNIAPLFDTTKAHRAGSTVPIKVQVRDAANVNLSSPDLSVTAHKLVRLDDGSAVAVVDSGNTNADAAFRFEPTLGASGGYIFNLSTRHLTRGRYGLSISVGGDKAFLYNVSFEIR